MYSEDSSLLSLAIMCVDHDKGQEGFLEKFNIFVLSALSIKSVRSGKYEQIANIVQEECGIAIPESVLKKMVRLLIKGEFVVENDGLYALTQRGQVLVGEYDVLKSGFQQKRDVLVDCLREYISEESCAERNFSDQEIEDAFVSIISRNSLSILGRVKDMPLRVQRRDEDALEYLISKFIHHISEEDARLFRYLVAIAQGVILASLFEFEVDDSSRSLKGMRVYLDTPILMDYLGFHDEYRATLAKKLIMRLKEQAVKVCIFEHTLAEVIAILDRAQEALRSRTWDPRRPFPAYYQFLRTRRTASDVMEIELGLERRLEEEDIHRVQAPPNLAIASDVKDTLEGLISSLLSSYLPAQDEHRAENDVNSLAAVYRKREGKTPSDFSSCTDLLLTRNDDLASCSRDSRLGVRFPLAITLDYLSAYLWIREPAMADGAARDILLANAYAGMQPKEVLWSAYIEKVNFLKASGKINEDMLLLLCERNVTSHLVMEQTLGDRQKVTNDTPLKVYEAMRNSEVRPYLEKIAEFQGEKERDRAAQADLEKTITALESQASNHENDVKCLESERDEIRDKLERSNALLRNVVKVFSGLVATVLCLGAPLTMLFWFTSFFYDLNCAFVDGKLSLNWGHGIFSFVGVSLFPLTIRVHRHFSGFLIRRFGISATDSRS